MDDRFAPHNMYAEPKSLARLSPLARPNRQKRVILLLQGHPSRFWPELSDALTADGHRVLHVNLCLADKIFWGRRRAINYRGRFSRWQSWLHDLLLIERVSDIIYYADRLPYHRVACALGKKLGVACWAIEHGYLRPDWLTMEPDAMGARSHFPTTRKEIDKLAERAETPDLNVRFSHSFAAEAFHEVTYHLLQAFGRPFYPWYWSDKIYWPLAEYLNWIGELALEPKRKKAAKRVQKSAASGELEYNLVAMQIQADYQIRGSSRYHTLEDFLNEVMQSFAQMAPAKRHLVVKLHPLDNGLERWFHRIARLTEKHNLHGRVHVIKGGDLRVLIRACRGVVLVNSTVGIHALREATPTFCAGQAVYNLEGLTHQNGLDAFWETPEAPNPAYFANFEKALTHIQIKGSFFDPNGRRYAIEKISSRFRA